MAAKNAGGFYPSGSKPSSDGRADSPGHSKRKRPLRNGQSKANGAAGDGRKNSGIPPKPSQTPRKATAPWPEGKYVLCYLKFNEKVWRWKPVPRDEGWQKGVSAAEAQAHWKAGNPVGVVAASLGVTLIDFDAGGADAVANFRKEFGPPIAEHASGGRGRYHLWYAGRFKGKTVALIYPGGGSGEVIGTTGYANLWDAETLFAGLAAAREANGGEMPPAHRVIEAVKEWPKKPVGKTRKANGHAHSGAEGAQGGANGLDPWEGLPPPKDATEAKLRADLALLSADDGHIWITYGRAIRRWDNTERGLTLWRLWSRTSANWKQGCCTERWARMDDTEPQGDPVTIDSIHAAAYEVRSKRGKKAGEAKDKLTAKSTVKDAELDAGYVFSLRHGPAAQKGGAGEQFRFDLHRKFWRRLQGGIWVRPDRAEQAAMKAIFMNRRRHARVIGGLKAAESEAGMSVPKWNLGFGIATQDADGKGGWIEIETGKHHRGGNPRLLATGAIPKAAGEVPKEWRPFVLNQVCSGALTLAGRREMARWLQAWCWSALSGQGPVYERFLFLHGPPGGGKSTFADVLAKAFGMLAIAVPGVRVAGWKNQQAHREWIARADGKRLLQVDEVPPTGEWNCAELQALVSGERVSANYMRQNSFDLEFTGGVIVTGNHKPRVSPDAGLFRRMSIVEVGEVPEDDRDPQFKKSLLEAASEGRLLNWILAGREAFEAGVLAKRPGVMREWVEEYRTAQDIFGEWLSECCQTGRNLEEGSTRLLESYRNFTGQRKISSQKFAGLMKKAGFKKDRARRGTVWYGIALEHRED